MALITLTLEFFSISHMSRLHFPALLCTRRTQRNACMSNQKPSPVQQPLKMKEKGTEGGDQELALPQEKKQLRAVGADLQRWQPPLTFWRQVTACWNSALTLAQLEDTQLVWLQAEACTSRAMVLCSCAALSACCSWVSLTWVSFTGCRFACNMGAAVSEGAPCHFNFQSSGPLFSFWSQLLESLLHLFALRSRRPGRDDLCFAPIHRDSHHARLNLHLPAKPHKLGMRGLQVDPQRVEFRL